MEFTEYSLETVTAVCSLMLFVWVGVLSIVSASPSGKGKDTAGGSTQSVTTLPLPKAAIRTSQGQRHGSGALPSIEESVPAMTTDAKVKARRHLVK